MMNEVCRQSPEVQNRSVAWQPCPGHAHSPPEDCTVADLLKLEALISKISARLLRAAPETLDEEIEHALAEIFLHLGIDRGGLLEVWENSPVVTVSHAWYSEGAKEVSGDINLAALYPWSYRQLVGQGEIIALHSLDDLPAEAAIDRRSFAALDVKSSLTIPLTLGERVYYLIVVHAIRKECVWHKAFIRRLSLIGEIFVSALQRRDAYQTLSRNEARLELAAASANAGLWEFDLFHKTMWATDKARELFGYSSTEVMTPANALAKVHPDDRKIVLTAIDQACALRQELSIEYRLLPEPDGRTRWIHSRGRLQRTAAKDNGRIMGISMEITEHKEMEQRLQEQIREVNRLQELLERENVLLRKEVAICDETRHVTGASKCMLEILAKIEQVADTDSTVLILGETGTGKELIAQSIHRLSKREKRMMVTVNCAALPAALVESELFGREKGAFTGALSKQVGRYEIADGSTLFLDEIAEMPLETQAKLLRVLQDGKFERLGSPRSIKVDVRIIAATNRNLAAEVELGRFRRDLFYRLNVFPIHVPPLRERLEDIPNLVWKFVDEFGQKMGKKIRRINNRDLEMLNAYSWPGNIRELRNVIEHALIVCKDNTLRIPQLTADPAKDITPLTLAEAEREHILATLKATRGRIKGKGGAAALLMLNPSTLYSRMRKLNITPARA